MRLIVVLATAALAAVTLTACGGSSTRDTAPAADPVAAVEETSTESGIPGLTEAEVAAQPEVPPLPGSITAESQPEDLDAEISRLVAAEQRGKKLGELTPEKRTIYVGHIWGEALQALRRGQASTVAGLTIGELEDQPAAPELPAIFDSNHASQDLLRHARVVALEEQAQGLLGDLDLEKRAVYLAWFWEKPLAERQAIEQHHRDLRAKRLAQMVAEAQRQAEWEARNVAVEDEYADKIREAKMQHNDVLSDEQKDELEMIVRTRD